VAITFVAAGATVGASSPGTSPIAVAVPSGVANGAVLLMISCRTGTAGSGAYSTPSGWVNIPAWTISSGTAARHSFGAYRVASSEPASYNLTTADPAEEVWGAVMLAYRGVDSSTQLDATPVGDITQVDTNNGDPPSITTVTNGAWVVCFDWVRNGGDLTAFSPPSSYTERVDNVSTFLIGVADRAIAVAGAENPGAFGTGGVGGTNDHIVGTLALRPAAAAGGGSGPAIFKGVNLGKNLINGGGLIKC
jgi:hypothetical protein